MRIALALLLATPAFAAPTTAEIQQRLDRAVTHIRAGDCAAALDEMRPIDAAVRERGDLVAFRWNSAYCLDQTEQHAAAAAAYSQLLTLDPPAKLRARATRRVAALEEQHLARLEVTCEPEGSTVQLGEADPLPCPATWRWVDAGRHQLVVRSPAGLEQTHRLELTAGTASTPTVTVRPVLEIHSRAPGVRVQVDARHRGDAGPDTPLVLFTLPTGRHAIRATHPATGEVFEQTRWLRAGERTVVELPFEGIGGSPRVAAAATAPDDDDTWLWVGIGTAAAVGLGVGAYFLLSGDGETEPRPLAYRPEF